GKARADFDKVLELDPEYALAHAAIGAAIYRHDDYENATAEFDIAINSAEWILQKAGGIGLAGVYKSRGRNYKALRDYNKSIEDYNMAMNYNPVVDGHQIGNYEMVGEWEKAIELYDMRIADTTYTRKYSAYYGKGECYCQLGLYDEAMEMYDEAFEDCLKNWPDRLSKVYEQRGDCYFMFEEYDKALEMYNKSAEDTKNYPSSWYRTRLYTVHSKIGNVYLALEDYDKAVENYNESISIAIEEGRESSLADTYKGLGIAYKEHGEKDKARAALEKAIELYEEYGEAGHGKEENIEECQKLIDEL
ncbi:MAG: tetratricopeptide repeat protein, partial [Proteobacteria bacterium]|nr:tetratricopeptide repeat protein [Pseudomonadota bacterium]